MGAKLRIAEASRDETAIWQLSAEVAKAAGMRASARQSLLDHERDSGHGETAEEIKNVG
jgi:hypothetical protein